MLTNLGPRKVLAITAVAIGFTALIVVWNQPALLKVGTLISLLKEKPPPKLPVPVAEVASKDLADTWGAPRGTDRNHEGIDIFAPRGRPVMSTTNGVVFKVGEDNLGGHVVRVLGPGWQWHYYAHLDRFGDIGLGSLVQQGTVLGYVGNTGNASGTPSHLHYGVYRFLGGARNPYPMLVPEPLDLKIKKTTRRGARAVRSTRVSHSRRHAPATRSRSRVPPRNH